MACIRERERERERDDESCDVREREREGMSNCDVQLCDMHARQFIEVLRSELGPNLNIVIPIIANLSDM